MTDKNENADRDDVLFAFHQECSQPTVDDISTWVRRYPQFAEDIRIHAGIARDMADEEENSMEVPEAVFRRGYSRALSALYSADLENVASESDTYHSFEAVLEARGKTIPTLANEIDIRRSIIADLFGGRASPPLSKRMTRIYGIRNCINNKWYVGQSQDVEKRLRTHFKRASSGVDSHLYRAIRKFGEVNFEQHILEATLQSKLDVRERFYVKKLDAMNSGYNKTSGGERGSSPSEETRAILGAKAKVQMHEAGINGTHPAQKEAHRKWLGDLQRKLKAEGKHPMSRPEVRSKISERQKELLRKGLHFSQNEEWRAAHSKKQKMLAAAGLHNSQTAEAREASRRVATGNTNMLGRKRITDGVCNTTIRAGEELPTGWRFGQTWIPGKKRS